ncbi:nucleoside-triphosphatase [Desulfosporosinus meridiei]|uniref:Putative nucleotide kinase n=1 Tax=Desulfosporosinus meridiei (strain ATCC BAA-275 / DSM 13257 / KCTC 12902 / NCIMB 13706 / S10) TaxID=768704 RepID=J7IUK7_DESMD|nr:nucleoside-triphosphatase [Desulfosporosinus meridiei]AFQ43829.1 putative nucleotide kinase [Desulfosporosinus meridiei DSM 13257]
MHIFLTGEIQIGKSTVINKTLDLLQITPQGFRTYFGPDRTQADRLLYLDSAAKPQTFNEEKAVVHFRAERPPEVLVKRFDGFGAQLIRRARADSESALILMDECGSLESGAQVFQQEILAALDGNKPILGVVKLTSRGWTDQIREHAQVALLTVTRENRDRLPELLAHFHSG